MPGAVMMYISACTMVLDDPQRTEYYVCMYVRTNNMWNNWATKSKYDFLLHEMFLSSPAKNDGFQQCLQQYINNHGKNYYSIEFTGYFLT